MKIHDCNRCSLYAHNPHLVCAVHPDGVETDKCFLKEDADEASFLASHMDFRLDSNAHIEEQWSPNGYSWYGDELISNRPRCGQALSRYSQSEQNELVIELNVY